MADPLVRIRFQGDEAVQGADRVSRALSRMERSEPTRALRATRAAVDELAASASGLDPRLGRLASVFAQFGIGGVVGLAAVAGLGAIGLEIKKIITLGDGMDERLGKINAKFAAMVPSAARFAAIGALRQEQERDKTGGFGEWFFRRGAGGLSDIGEAMRTERLARVATEENEITLQMIERHRDYTRTLLEHRNAVESATIAYDRARLGAHASGFALEGLAEREETVKLSTQHLTAAERERIESLDTQTRLLTGLNAVVRDLDAGMPALLEELQQIRGVTLKDLRVKTIGPDDIIPQQVARAKQFVEFRAQEQEDASHKAALRAIEAGKGTDVVRSLAPAISAAFAAFAAFSGGGSAAQVGALGGLASGISAIKGVGAGASTALGIGGIILSGLSSLFGGGPPKVTISSFEAAALRQIQELRGDPLTTSFTFVGGDPRQTAYQLGRLQRRDAATRSPY